jgi:hypothetical protein
MKFTDFLAGNIPQLHEDAPPSTAPNNESTVVQTQYYDANHQPVHIYVKADVTHTGNKVTRIQPSVVKWNGKIVPYDRFLQAIPELNNEALFEPMDHLDAWSAWIT